MWPRPVCLSIALASSPQLCRRSSRRSGVRERRAERDGPQSTPRGLWARDSSLSEDHGLQLGVEWGWGAMDDGEEGLERVSRP